MLRGGFLAERAWSLRGLDIFMMDMVIDPIFAEELLERITEIQLALIRRFIDLGVDVTPDQFVTAIQESEAQLVGMSALLTTTMPMMRNIIQAIEGAGVRDQVKIMVGGAGVTQDYADDIGADGYAPDASAAVRKAKELLAVAA